MGYRNTHESYGGLNRFIHWVTATLIVVLIPLGLYMHGLDASPFKVSLYFIHKSLGAFVLGLTLLRLVWMVTNPKPALLGALKPWERKLAHIVHGLFYLLMIGVPVSGWVMSSAHGYPVSVYGWFTLPNLVGESHDLAELMEEIHELGAWTLVGLIALHMVAVIKHQGVYKDDTLSRMMPNRKIWFIGLPVMLALAFAPAVGKSLNGDAPAGTEDDHTHAESDHHDDDDDDDAEYSTMRWRVDHENSRLQFVATIEGAEIQGTFTEYDADIRFDPDDLEHSKVEVEINLASVDSGNAERDDALRSAAWFHTDKYQYAGFEADDFTHIGGNDYIAEGELEIRDVEKDVKLPFTLDISIDEAGKRVALMSGELVLNRIAFGLGADQWDDPQTVAHEVGVLVNLRAVAGLDNMGADSHDDNGDDGPEDSHDDGHSDRHDHHHHE